MPARLAAAFMKVRMLLWVQAHFRVDLLHLGPNKHEWRGGKDGARGCLEACGKDRLGQRALRVSTPAVPCANRIVMLTKPFARDHCRQLRNWSRRSARARQGPLALQTPGAAIMASCRASSSASTRIFFLDIGGIFGNGHAA